MDEKEMMEKLENEIQELSKIYEKDKNIFNKIATLFNTHLQNSSLTDLEDNLERDLEILLSGDYLGTIVVYVEFANSLELSSNLDESFLSELKYCSLLISNSLIESNRAKSNPLGISSIKRLSSSENSMLLELKRNDLSSIVFDVDIESLEGIKNFFENLITEFKNDDSADGE